MPPCSPWLSGSAGRPPPSSPGCCPGELEAALTAGPDAGEPFDAEEFARRTAARARVDPGRGREYATAVLATLREDVAGIQELRDRLPADYRPLFG
jgi:uncharacterized protein (DUF2267 family)